MIVLAHESHHIYQADHNEQFLDNISTEFIDWKFIVLYYAALHLGDAFIAKKRRCSVGFSDHKKRKEVYLKEFDKEAFKSYIKLENYSKLARYQPDQNYTLNETKFDEALTIDFPKIKAQC